MASKPPALILPDGRPLTRENLGIEIARPARASIRNITSSHPAQGLTPERLAGLLLSAEQGDAVSFYELAEEMEEKDLHYLSVLNTRKRGVSQLPVTVKAADESPQAMEDKQFIENWLERDMLIPELFDMLDGVGKGISATEIVYDMKPTSWLPKALKWRDPRWFEFDKDTGEELLLRGGADGLGMPTPLQAGKFIVHLHPSKSGLPVRGGLARIAAWGYMFKNFAIKDWVIFLERYGHPIRLGKYGPNESEENKRILFDALYDLGSDAAAAFPETMSVEFKERSAGVAPNDLWRSHAEYFDQQISKLVLGQTNTTDAQSGGLGSGQAQVHNEVRHDIETHDAVLLSATINRDLVVPMIMLNRGPREKYPRLKIGRPEAEDIKVTVETAKTLADMGVQIDGEELRDRAGLPAAKSPATALRPSSAALSEISPLEGADGLGGPGSAEKDAPRFLSPLKRSVRANERDIPALQSQQTQREPDALALTADEALSDWEPLVDPILGPIDALMQECETIGELQARLVEAIGSMDTDAFTEDLARGLFAVRIAGFATSAEA